MHAEIDKIKKSRNFEFIMYFHCGLLLTLATLLATVHAKGEYMLLISYWNIQYIKIIKCLDERTFNYGQNET